MTLYIMSIKTYHPLMAVRLKTFVYAGKTST